MTKRILIVICFIPAVFLTVCQMILYIVRWVFTGKEFPDDPIIEKLMNWADETSRH